tara:strand:+ start:44 stop:496 length:453 start_codon:yes stop_codon:yes gene_type:complete
MIKKIFLLIVFITFISGCNYSPVHLIKGDNIEIKVINTSGNKEINNYILKELKQRSKKSNEKIEVKIDTNYSKRILAKDTKSFATDYELKVEGNFELIKNNKSKSFMISEKFRYKNLNNNYEQNNYESIIKRNLTKTIVRKLNLRINNFK